MKKKGEVTKLDTRGHKFVDKGSVSFVHCSKCKCAFSTNDIMRGEFLSCQQARENTKAGRALVRAIVRSQ